ncbi:E3 ubiquitin-protein ligase LNX [Hondaea fermentalgiana]|uniref:E3 ubiquitin-protein ligase LNX n=1 Tax=Hondaea fermentalgiana TaxID=2315210 RepID=A0A2R5G0G9_9STRA|nr:E3 ubiquitin-protein ligase LNX [Hondaea fermentalgiana]|eukprot:GBG24512.1 E3 ubiquitin-protein ligase LNX [Hondaea fermentalgiana]
MGDLAATATATATRDGREGEQKEEELNEEELDVREIVKCVQAIGQDLTCSICYSLLKDPLMTPCRHVFCTDCLKRSLCAREVCPLCKTEVTRRTTRSCDKLVLVLKHYKQLHPHNAKYSQAPADGDDDDNEVKDDEEDTKHKKPKKPTDAYDNSAMTQISSLSQIAEGLGANPNRLFPGRVRPQQPMTSLEYMRYRENRLSRFSRLIGEDDDDDDDDNHDDDNNDEGAEEKGDDPVMQGEDMQEDEQAEEREQTTGSPVFHPEASVEETNSQPATSAQQDVDMADTVVEATLLPSEVVEPSQMAQTATTQENEDVSKDESENQAQDSHNAGELKGDAISSAGSNLPRIRTASHPSQTRRSTHVTPVSAFRRGRGPFLGSNSLGTPLSSKSAATTPATVLLPRSQSQSQSQSQSMDTPLSTISRPRPLASVDETDEKPSAMKRRKSGPEEEDTEVDHCPPCNLEKVLFQESLVGQEKSSEPEVAQSSQSPLEQDQQEADNNSKNEEQGANDEATSVAVNDNETQHAIVIEDQEEPVDEASQATNVAMDVDFRDNASTQEHDDGNDDNGVNGLAENTGANPEAVDPLSATQKDTPEKHMIVRSSKKRKTSTSRQSSITPSQVDTLVNFVEHAQSEAPATHIDAVATPSKLSKSKSKAQTTRNHEPESALTDGTSRPRFALGDFVTVARRMQPGMNKPGGVGKITKVHSDGTYDIRYALDGRREKMVEAIHLTSGIDVNSTSLLGSHTQSTPATPVMQQWSARGRPKRRSAPRDRFDPESFISQAEIAQFCRTSEKAEEAQEKDNEKEEKKKGDENRKGGRERQPLQRLPSRSSRVLDAANEAKTDTNVQDAKETSSSRGKRRSGTKTSSQRQKRRRGTKTRSASPTPQSDEEVLPTAAGDTKASGPAKKSKSTKRRTRSRSPGPEVALSSTKRPTIVLTSLSSEARRQNIVDDIYNLHGEVELEDTERATHLVVPCIRKASQGRIAKARTLKYVRAIAAGLWIVDVRWVRDSANANAWLAEGPYEIQGDMKTIGLSRDGPKRSREAHAQDKDSGKGLFAGVTMFLCGSFAGSRVPPKRDLESIFAMCGGTLIRNRRDLEAARSAGASSMCVVLCENLDTARQDPHYAAITAQPNVRVLTPQWLLNSVSTYEVQDTSPYTATPAVAAGGR